MGLLDLLVRRRSEPLGTPALDTAPDSMLYAASRVSDRQIDELVGLCKGVLADGHVSQAEAEMVLGWLQANPESLHRWPCDVIFARLSLALEDGVFDADEQREVLALLTDVTGGAAPAEVHSLSTALPLTEPAPQIVFEGRKFCLTGSFFLGKRSDVSDAIMALGGEMAQNPSRFVDYLVIGEVGSKAWMHSTHGRKIEKAAVLAQKGQIEIVAERSLADALKFANG